MIPKRLEIQGLYSYQEMQVIDFEKLTEAGLFGIFGPVGSGKSSILEAILLALYGSTERLSVAGERSSMVNLQSDSLLINFEFLSGKANQNRYLARYSAKRNKKVREKIDTGEHTFYEQSGDNWNATEKGAEEILGMKKEHFKQTVIIPQGKFREFIDLKPKDQASMMKELFGLQRFDLSIPTRVLKKEVEENLIRLRTKLEGLEDISEELLRTQESEKSELNTEIDALHKSIQSKNSEFKKLEKLQAQRIELIALEKEKSELEGQREEILKQKKEQERFMIARDKIRPAWDAFKEVTTELEKNQKSLEECQRWVPKYDEEIQELEKNLISLRERSDKRPDREAKIRDLKKVLEIQEWREKLQNLSQRLELEQPKIDEQKSALRQAQKELADLEKSIEDIKLPSVNDLSNWKSWVSESGSLRAQKENILEIEGNSSQAIENLSQQKEALLKDLPPKHGGLAEWESAIQKRINEVTEEVDKLRRKLGLAGHVHLLEDGEPCPLCGSIDHPAPLDNRESDRLEKIEINKAQLEKELAGVEHLITQSSELAFKTSQLEQELDHRKKEKEKIDNGLEAILQRIKGIGFENEEELTEGLQDYQKEISTQEEKLEAISRRRKSMDELRLRIETSEREIHSTQKQFEQIQTSIETKKNDFSDPEFCKKYLEEEPQKAQQIIDRVSQDIQRTEEQLKSSQRYFEERKEKQTINSTNLRNFESRVKSLLKEKEEKGKVLTQLKSENDFEDEQELKSLFDLSLDVEKIAKKIREFEDRWRFVETRIFQLLKSEELKDFDEAYFEKLEEEILQGTQNLEDQRTKLALLTQDIEKLKESLKTKETLESEEAGLEKRESYLKELERLFHGSGFVKYVSSIYLQELCHTANLRFMKLTKNQLAIEVDSNNIFWVIDYLNGGEKRLLKSLSGGQTFQACLCLALALAEKIKALNQADQSFFFMDEGFGALDKNSLSVVFDTLKSLQFENRVVGIISHVEDLQQEIGVYAKVNLDPERGSQISYSYA